ncbi:MAG TPA: hypothetical protein VF590_12275 [Isosphaeraceae bacterium]
MPKEQADRFPAEGSHLERYATRFPAVENNSSFYKPHRPDASEDRPSILMGRLARGERGSLRVTILPTAREQSEHCY